MQNSFFSHEEAATRNRNSILRFVRNHAPISRTEIWEKVNISRASVTQIIRQLQEMRLIEETGEGASSGGRKPRYLTFCGCSRKFYAFDWASGLLCLMDLDGAVLAQRELHFPKGILPLDFSVRLKDEIAQIDAQDLYAEEELVGIGLSLPGQIDCRTGTVLYSVELGWQNTSLRELFSDRFGSRVYLERSGNLMALGQSCVDSTHFQLFILGTDGIGVSTVIRGSCQHGANYMHGELGHIKMPCEVPCSCGQRGCLEAVVRELLQNSRGEITEQVLEYLAVGVSTSVNISDADTILLVGTYVEKMTDVQKQTLRRRILENVTSSYMRRMDIRFGENRKELTQKGFSTYLFDRTFPVDE